MTAGATLSSTDVSAYIKRLEVWRKATEGVGRFLITLDNKTSRYINTFAADHPVAITVDSAILLKGYLDRIKPQLTQRLESKLEETFFAIGRDNGQDLQNKLYDYIYYPQKADDIIADLLVKAGCEVTYSSPSTAPVIYFDSKGAFLSDSLREILELIDYDGFVDENKVWNMFPIGSIDSGITLKAVAGASDNNILQIVDHEEKDGSDIRNYIIVFGEKILDGWTEGNASDWAGLTGNIVTDDNKDTGKVAKGTMSIRCAKGTAGYCQLSLSFPKYNYDQLDVSPHISLELAFQIYQDSTYPSLVLPTVRLTDHLGNKIYYAPSQWMDTPGWGQVVVPIGGNVEIASGQPGDKWYYSIGSTFSWKIKQIDIAAFPGADFIVVDALTLPVAGPGQLIAVAQNPASQSAYKVRKLPLVRRDISSQFELQQYADSILAKRKDPLDRLSLIARGDAGFIGGVWKWIPGYKVTVNIPTLGLNNTAYRIIEVHHILDREHPILGFDHVVELFLVPANAKLETQRWSYGSGSQGSGQAARFRALRDRARYHDQKEMDVRDWYPALPKPIWDIYGKLPSNGLNINLPMDNMMSNANFDIDYNKDGVPDNWQFGSAGVGSTVAMTDNGIEGKKAIRVTLSAASSYGYVESDIIPVQEGEKYLARCQVISQYFEYDTAVFICAVWYDADKANPTETEVGVGSLQTWSEKIATLTCPSGKRYARLRLKFMNIVGGSKWAEFDSVWMFKELAWAQIMKDNFFAGLIGLTKFEDGFLSYIKMQNPALAEFLAYLQHSSDNIWVGLDADLWTITEVGDVMVWNCNEDGAPVLAFTTRPLSHTSTWTGRVNMVNVDFNPSTPFRILTRVKTETHLLLINEETRCQFGVWNRLTGASKNAIFCYSLNMGAWMVVVVNNGTPTVKIEPGLSSTVWRNLRLDISSTKVELWIDGVSQGSFTTDIPVDDMTLYFEHTSIGATHVEDGAYRNFFVRTGVAMLQ